MPRTISEAVQLILAVLQTTGLYTIIVAGVVMIMVVGITFFVLRSFRQ